MRLVPGEGSFGGIPVGHRRGYDISHVVTPRIWGRTTVEARHALKVFLRYNPHAAIVWQDGGHGRLYWMTAERARVEAELLDMARKRTRGIQRSFAELARWTGTTPDMVSRVLRSFVARGMGMLEVGRGRGARAVFRLVGKSIPQPNTYKAAALTDEEASARYMARFSDEELAKIEADAYAWRLGLARSLEQMGFTGPDAEGDYLAYMASVAE